MNALGWSLYHEKTTEPTGGRALLRTRHHNWGEPPTMGTDPAEMFFTPVVSLSLRVTMTLAGPWGVGDGRGVAVFVGAAGTPARFVGVAVGTAVAGRSTTGRGVTVGGGAADSLKAPNTRKLPQRKVAPRARTSNRLMRVRNCP